MSIEKDNQELSQSELEKIERHLKAEAEIQEAHSIIDDILKDPAAAVEKKMSPLWMIGLALIAGLVLLSIWFLGQRDSNKEKQPNKDLIPIEKNSENVRDLQKNENEKIWKDETDESDLNARSSKNKEKKELPMANVEDDRQDLKSMDQEEQLIAANFSPVSWKESNLRSSSNAAPKDLKSSIRNMYSQRKYSSALSALHTLSKEYPEDWEILFFQSVCQLQLEVPETGKAIEGLNAIIANDDNIYLEEANWFLIGALIQSGEKSKASEILRQNFLIYPNSKYHTQAKRIEQFLR